MKNEEQENGKGCKVRDLSDAKEKVCKIGGANSKEKGI